MSSRLSLPRFSALQAPPPQPLHLRCLQAPAPPRLCSFPAPFVPAASTHPSSQTLDFAGLSVFLSCPRIFSFFLSQITVSPLSLMPDFSLHLQDSSCLVCWASLLVLVQINEQGLDPSSLALFPFPCDPWITLFFVSLSLVTVSINLPHPCSHAALLHMSKVNSAPFSPSFPATAVLKMPCPG